MRQVLKLSQAKRQRERERERKEERRGGDTTRLTGCTTVTASGLEAALPVLALLPTCCDRRRSFVPEASGTGARPGPGRGPGPLAKIWSWLVNTTFTTSTCICICTCTCTCIGGFSGVDCGAGVCGCGGGAADVGAAERTLGQRTGHRGEGDAPGPLLNDLGLLLIHKDADAAASDQRGFIGKFVLCLQLVGIFFSIWPPHFRVLIFVFGWSWFLE